MADRPVPEVRAFIAADIVASTALRSALGDERADRVLRAFVDISTAATARSAGVARRWAGDGMTASFPTASAAVTAALSIQRAVRAYSRRADSAGVFEVRIGVAVGEVVYDPADAEEHGVAVVEAARLEPLAAPGEVLATELVQILGQRRSNARFEPVGPITVKGFDERLSVVRVVDATPDEGVLPVPGSLAFDRRFPLVGRSDALARALSCWHDAEGGHTQSLLISGQPGIGKTRLVSQIAHVAHDARALVLAGVCDAEFAVPYQPIALALADAKDLHPELEAAVVHGDGPLGALFPSRRTRRDDGGGADRLELFDAVVGVIEGLALVQPVVIVLDDVQWATVPTVQLLRHMIRRLDRTRVLLVATCRPEALSISHPLTDVLVELRASKRATTIELGLLGLTEIAELTAARLGNARPDQVEPFASRVLEESSGNPFFVCELIDHLAATGQLADVAAGRGERLPLPDSVRGVVGQRVGRLSPEVSDLLVTAAVVGHSFEVELLAKLLDLRSDRVIELVEEAAEAALVQEIDMGVFAFAHAMVRSTVLERLSATRRSMIHRRIAEALTELRPNDHDQLAVHWRLAGVDDRGRFHTELAARRDLEAFAFESAAERFQELIDFHAAAETIEAARAWLGLGQARRALGQPDYLAATYEAGRIGRRLHDGDVLAEAAVGSIWPGTYLRPGEGMHGILELAEDALAMIASDDPRRPRILATIGVHEFDPDRRNAVLGEALAAAERVGDPALVGHVLVALHIANWNPDTLDERAAIIDRLKRVARLAGLPELEYYVGLFAVFNAAERGDVARARQHLRELEPSTRAAHGVYLEFLAERISVSLEMMAGFPDAQARIDELATRFADTHADTANTWAAQTAMLATHQGRMREMVPAIRAVLAQGTPGAHRNELGASAVAETWAPSLGLTLALAGEREEAAEILASLREPSFDYFWLVFMTAASDLAAELEDATAAQRLYTRLSPYRDQLCLAGPGSVVYGLVATCLGRLAILLGRHAEAIELLTRAVARADEIGAPYESVRARRVLAEALFAAGADPSAVASAIGPALADATDRGFAAERDRLTALLASNANR